MHFRRKLTEQDLSKLSASHPSFAACLCWILCLWSLVCFISLVSCHSHLSLSPALPVCTLCSFHWYLNRVRQNPLLLLLFLFNRTQFSQSLHIQKQKEKGKKKKKKKASPNKKQTLSHQKERRLASFSCIRKALRSCGTTEQQQQQQQQQRSGGYCYDFYLKRPFRGFLVLLFQLKATRVKRSSQPGGLPLPVRPSATRGRPPRSQLPAAPITRSLS